MKRRIRSTLGAKAFTYKLERTRTAKLLPNSNCTGKQRVGEGRKCKNIGIAKFGSEVH